MLFTPQLFSSAFLHLCDLLMLALFAVALWRCPWRALLDVPLRQHLLWGTTFSLTLLWALSLQVNNNIGFHFLGITASALLLGVSLTVMAGAIAQSVLVLLGFSEWSVLSLHLLVNCVLPAGMSVAILWLIRRFGPKNLFFYMLGAGFFGGGVVILGVVAATLLLLWWVGHELLVSSALEQVAMMWFLVFPEGFLNGMLVTSLTVFRPEWVKTFDDHYYLDPD